MNNNDVEIVRSKLEHIIILLSLEGFSENVDILMKEAISILEDINFLNSVKEDQLREILDKISAINSLIETNKKKVINHIQDKEKELSLLESAMKNLKELI